MATTVRLTDTDGKPIGVLPVKFDQTTPGTTNGVQIVAEIPAGTKNIGDVDVVTLPALPAGTNNIGKVTVDTHSVADITFQNAVVAPATGSALSVGGYKTLLAEIWGTSTSRTVQFEALGPEGATYRPLMGIRVSDYATAVSTTGTGEMWQFDISGLTSVRMNLTAVSGGNVSVKGKAVA